MNCVLALKSYNEWKQAGGNGSWKFSGNVRTTTTGKQFVRKNSEPFMSSQSRSMSMNEKSQNGVPSETDSNRTVSAVDFKKAFSHLYFSTCELFFSLFFTFAD